MSEPSTPSTSTGLSEVAFPVERSSYYHFWQDEMKALDVHKYYLSERVGKDVGLAYSHWDWITKGHRARWMAARASGLA